MDSGGFGKPQKPPKVAKVVLLKCKNALDITYNLFLYRLKTKHRQKFKSLLSSCFGKLRNVILKLFHQ